MDSRRRRPPGPGEKDAAMYERAPALPAFETLLYEERDHVATLTLNRPERMNSVNRQMEADLAQVWARVRRNPEIWVVIVTGAGERAFCAGVDNFESRDEKETIPPAQRWFQPALQHITARQNQIYKPV